MSGAHYRLRPKAQEDVLELALYIAKDNPDAALRFIDAVEATCARLAEMPKIGVTRTFKHPALAGIRMLPTRGFEHYLIFYLPAEGGIDVVRVIHGARDLPALFS